MNRKQLYIFIVATLLWIGVKLGQFMMRSQGFFFINDSSLVAAVVGISGLMGFILRFPLGVLADKIKHKLLIIKISILLSIASALIHILFSSIYTLYVYNLFMGIAICTWVLLNVLYCDSGEKLFMNVAILAIANNIGSFVGPMLGGILIPSTIVDGISQFDFTNLITTKVSLIILLLAFLFTFFIEETPPKGKIKFSLKNIIDNRLISVAIIGLIIHFTKYATLKYTFEKIVGNMGGIPFYVGSIDAFYDIFHIIGGLAAVKMCKKIGISLTTLMGVAIMSILFICAYYANALIPFLLFNLIAGFGMGIAYITTMSVSIQNCSQEYKNSRMGIYQGIGMFGVFVAPKVCNLLSSLYSVNSIYLFSGVFGFILVAIFCITLKEKKYVN